MKRKIEEQEKQYKSLFENTGTATLIVEADTTISLINRQAEILMGYPKEEVEGKINFQELIAYEEEVEEMLSYHQARQSNGEDTPNRYEFHLRDKEGVIKHILINVKMISETKQSILSLMDITENKKQEERLNQAYEKLNNNIEKARQLHQHLLPGDFPEINNLLFSAYYKPAQDLGGDFYNLEKTGNKLLFYLADVSGHGLDGAMLNVLIREKINSLNLESPKEIMNSVFTRYNQENFPDDYFLCLQIGILNLDKMELSYSNAGFHILPFIIENNGEVSSLLCEGFPITNILKENKIKFAEKYYKLSAGEKIFFTTDGLIEEMVDGELYGEARLKNILQKNYYLSSELMLEEIKNDFYKFTGNLKANDDITFFMIERKADKRLEKEIKSEFEFMYELEEEIIDFLTPYYHDVNRLQIGFHELLTNAIEHGNQFRSETSVKVSVMVSEGYIRLTIEDQGEGFEWQSYMQKTLDDIAFNERGRGIILAKEIYDQIKYNQKGNKVCLVKFR
jgi:PAS domain S-box-containing protein